MVLDWLFPPTCAGCGRWGERFCPDCLSKVELLSTDLCPKCSQPSPQGQVCHSCQVDPPPWQTCRAWAAYRGPLRVAVHRLKFKNDLGLSEFLGQHLVQLIQQQAWPVDCIIPVPLNPRRRRARGEPARQPPRSRPPSPCPASARGREARDGPESRARCSREEG